jgi:hypothetical protein
MIQSNNEAVAGAPGPMPDFMVVPLSNLPPERLREVEQTLADLGLTALYGDAATEFIANRNATNASEAEIAPGVQYASYKSFEDFGKDQGYNPSTPFRIWSRLRYAGTHYPSREAAEHAPDYTELDLSPRQLGSAVATYLRIVDRSPDGRAVEEIDLNGVYAFLRILLKNGYRIQGSPIAGLGATNYGILAHFVNEQLRPDPPLPLNT